MDAAYYGLDLGLPRSVEAMATRVNDQSAPVASAITYEFAERGNLAPVKYHWLDGGLMPPAPEGMTQADLLGDDHSGSLFIGDDGYMVTDTYTDVVRIFPESRFEEIKRNPPAETIARIPGGHYGPSRKADERVLTGTMLPGSPRLACWAMLRFAPGPGSNTTPGRCG
jgi:hypothetical protein